MALLCLAIYNDGTNLPIWQPDPETGKEYSSEQIDRGRLESVVIFGAAGQPLLVQWFDPGQRLILRRRVEQRVGEDKPHNIAILVGWQREIRGEHTQHVSLVFQNDEHIENIGHFRDDHHWCYGIREVPADAQIIG